MMVRVLDALVDAPEGNAQVEGEVREQVKALTARFPIYPELA